MKELPILFRGALVRAILASAKTQTRRVGPGAKRWDKLRPGDKLWVRETWYCDHCFAFDYEATRKSYLNRTLTDAECIEEWKGTDHSMLYYRADGEAHRQFEQLDHPTGRIWKPSIHMPRWASRLTLEVTSPTRTEPLQDISEVDARAEGVAANPYFMADGTIDAAMSIDARVNFSHLWDSVNGDRGYGWADNPVVRVISFRRLAP